MEFVTNLLLAIVMTLMCFGAGYLWHTEPLVSGVLIYFSLVSLSLIEL